MFTSILWIIIVMVLSMTIGILSGLNRKRLKKHSTIGTVTFVILTTTVTGAMIVVKILDITGDSWRYAAAIIQGIGFIGAGVMFKKNDSEDVKGLTTAVMLFADVILSTVLGLSLNFGKIEYSQPDYIPVDIRVLTVIILALLISGSAFFVRSRIAYNGIDAKNRSK